MAQIDKPQGQQPEALASLGEAARSGGMKPEQQGLDAKPETYPRPEDPDRNNDDATQLLRTGGRAEPKRETRTGSAHNAEGSSSGGAFSGAGIGDTVRHAAQSAADRIQENLPSSEQAVDALNTGLRQASDKAGQAARRFADDFREGRDPVREYTHTVIEQVQRQPVTAMIFAVLTGYVLARITGRD